MVTSLHFEFSSITAESSPRRHFNFMIHIHICCVLMLRLSFDNTGGGIWAVYPVIFSISYFGGIVHLTIAAVLSLSTLSSFILAALRPAGVPPTIVWGSYPAVMKGGLRNYTFCHYCSKPKSPRVHHCRSCGTCVLDMDHHCPFVSILAPIAARLNFVIVCIGLDCCFSNLYEPI